MKQGLLVLSLVIACAITLLAQGGGNLQQRDTDIRVVPLVRDGKVYVSFTFNGGLNDDMRASLKAGLATSITYEVELRREVPVWFDTTVASSTVVASAQYDNLTQLNQLGRAISDHPGESLVTADQEVVRQWMTNFDRLPLFSSKLLEANADYYVRVRARSKLRFNWFFFWPFQRGVVSGYARFTFIPQ